MKVIWFSWFQNLTITVKKKIQMNNFRINNMSNMNNIDEFISNQGFMSERTKSPRRIMPNMNQFF